MQVSLLEASLPTKQGFVSHHLLSSLLALIWAGILTVCGTALAQRADAQSVSQLINSGQIETARIVFEAENSSPADRIFFEARILKAKRRFLEAITAFRQVLQIDPHYINARRELAHTLLLNNDYGPARYHFEELLKIDQNDHMSDGYRGFLNVIDQNQPVRLNGYFSITPSTNVNRGTNNTAFDTTHEQLVIEPDSQAASGLGIQLGFFGHFRHLVSPTSRISLNWDTSSTRYKEKKYNKSVSNIAALYEKTTHSGGWSFSPYFRGTWREDNADNDARGLRFSQIRRLNDQTYIDISISHEYLNYAVLDYRNGTFTNASANLRHQVNPTLSVNSGFGFERSSPFAEHLQYDGSRLFFGLSKAWNGGLQTSIDFKYDTRDFVGNYPLTIAPRSDNSYQVSISIQHSRIIKYGSTPRLSCFHTIHQSNVAFYDYKITECRATISRNF